MSQKLSKGSGSISPLPPSLKNSKFMNHMSYAPLLACTSGWNSIHGFKTYNIFYTLYSHLDSSPVCLCSGSQAAGVFANEMLTGFGNYDEPYQALQFYLRKWTGEKYENTLFVISFLHFSIVQVRHFRRCEHKRNAVGP